MKKFNSWLNESNFEEKNIIKEVDFNSPFANVNRLSSLEKAPLKKFQRTIQDLKSKHGSDFKSTASNNRAMLLNSISLVPYDNVDDFMRDWNYVKNHVSHVEELTMDSSAELDRSSENSVKDNYNVDRK
jgi:hypothetical protein